MRSQYLKHFHSNIFSNAASIRSGVTTMLLSKFGAAGMAFAAAAKLRIGGHEVGPQHSRMRAVSSADQPNPSVPCSMMSSGVFGSSERATWLSVSRSFTRATAYRGSKYLFLSQPNEHVCSHRRGAPVSNDLHVRRPGAADKITNYARAARTVSSVDHAEGACPETHHRFGIVPFVLDEKRWVLALQYCIFDHCGRIVQPRRRNYFKPGDTEEELLQDSGYAWARSRECLPPVCAVPTEQLPCLHT